MKAKLHFFLKFILFWCLISLSSCSSSDETVECFPNSNINVQLDLNLPSNNALLAAGGWIYYQGSLSGTRGLIIVNAGNNIFKAYDRNAPHICPTSNSTLEVDNSLTLKCPEDGAKWILTSGQPVEIANRPPKTYQTSKNGNILIVTN